MRSSRGNGFSALALLGFVAAVGVAVTLAVTALVVWLTAVMDSMLAATLSITVAAVLVAVAIYLMSLRRPMRRIAERVENVYEVAEATRAIGEWIIARLPLLLTLRDLLFKDAKSDAK